MGVVHGRVLRIWREGNKIRFEAFPGDPDESLIRDYFRLDVNLAALYSQFAQVDPRMSGVIQRFKGLRVLRQEPEETLLSYICSAANSVKRISSSVEILSKKYGELIAEVENEEYYSFPTAATLAAVDSECMKGICSLGFRCANLNSIARQLSDRPGWLNSLRGMSYEDARKGLLELRGVGKKIADCVLLFSLDKDQAFPVDTHIRQIATRYYLPEFEQKSLTSAVYEQIVGHFQEKFGEYAGWAQEYLFYEDLLSREERSH